MAAVMAHALRAKREASPAPVGIPLELASLVASYGGRRGLSLRIERLPGQARFSRGRNNGDRTWSLAWEEIDDLVYLLPPGAEPHVLAVRVLSLDDDYGSTLALFDLPVSLPPVASAAPSPVGETAVARDLPTEQAEVAALRAALEARESELAQVKHQLSQVEAETARLIEADRAAAQIRFEADIARRLGEAAAEAAAHLEESRTVWQADADVAMSHASETWKAAEAARLATVEAQWRERLACAVDAVTARLEQADAALAEARAQADASRSAEDDLGRLRQRVSELQSALSDRDDALAEMQQTLARVEEDSAQRFESELTTARSLWQDELDRRLGAAAAEARQLRNDMDQARERWRQDTDAAIADAATAWKADEAARLAAAEARWREESAQAAAAVAGRCERAEAALAAARAEADMARGFEQDLRHLRAGMAPVKAALADRERELAKSRHLIDELKRESALAIESRVAAGRAEWQAELDRHRADEAAEFARIQAEAARGFEHKLQQMAAEITALKAALADRETSLSEARHLVDIAKADARGKTETLVAAAQSDWQVELDAKLLEITTLRSDLVERESELAEARRQRDDMLAASRNQIETELAVARLQWEADIERRLADAVADDAHAQENVDVAVAKAVEAQRADDAARLSEMEALWREQSEHTLVEAKAQLERSEAALAEARAAAERLPQLQNEIQRLREEAVASRAALADREARLTAAEADVERVREHWSEETQAALRQALEAWKVEETARLAAAKVEWQNSARIASTRAARTTEAMRWPTMRLVQRVVRAGAMAGTVAAAIVLYPRIEPLVIGQWWPRLVAVAARVETTHVALAALGRWRPEDSSKPATDQRIMVAAAPVNVRAAPSTGAAVLTTLQREMKVQRIERRGDWILVRLGGSEGERVQQGWVFGSFLRSESAQP